MRLRSLTTDAFRNLASTPIEFHPSVNLLVGLNGQGKTNVLEAIYFLATTKSFRTSRIGSVLRFGANSVFASGVVEREELARTHSVGLESGESRRRVLMINGEKVTLPAYLSALSVFAYSQSRLDIVRGAPEERRRFLDRGIASINPGYLDTLSRYARVLRQRNALIQEVASSRAAASQLDPWDEELALAGGAVHRARSAYTAELAKEFTRLAALHAYRASNLRITYRGSGDEAELRARLPIIRRHELRARMTLAGPQRDTVDLELDGRLAAEVLSGGEVKMLVLLMKFAKVELFRARFDEPPLFLLDDVDAELDVEILRGLLVRLPSRTQVFATSAKEPVLRALEAGPHRRLTIENGQVTHVADFA